MRIIETKVYSFDELNEDAKQKAIESVRDDEFYLDYQWYNNVYDWFIDSNKSFSVDKIYFSGFWSQGDGAMFEYSGINLQDEFIDQLDLSPMRKEWLRNNICTSGKGKHSGHYYHEKSCYHNIYWEIGNGDVHWSSNFGSWLTSFEDDFEEFVKDRYVDLSKDLYRKLEDEYNYLNSDECISEYIELNDIEFLEDGTEL